MTVILTVEDEFLISEYLGHVLEEAGYDVISTSNADEAIAVLESRNDIRVIITDINIPGSMNGLKLAAAVRAAVEKKGAKLAIVAPKIGGVTSAKGTKLSADHALSSAPSIFFDAVALLSSAEGAAMLVEEAAAIDWLRDAFGHLKVIGHNEHVAPFFEIAAVPFDANEGVVDLNSKAGLDNFIAAAMQHRIWDREPGLRSPG